MVKEEDRNREQKGGEKEEKRKVGSKDEGKRGSKHEVGQSGCVLSAGEECKMEGERAKNKQTNTRGDKQKRMPRTRQRNEAIGIPELAMNSRRLSYRSSYDGLWSPIIWQTASHLSSVSG